MHINTPAFGLISGVGTAIGLLLHILSLCFLQLIGMQPHSTTFFVVFTIGTKIFGESVFWKLCISRMDKEEELKNWRSVFNGSLLSQPNVFVSLFMLFTDGLADAFLVYMALKTSIPIIWVFLSFFGCQMLASPIQGILSDYFSQKKSLLFAALMGLLTYVIVTRLNLDEKSKETSIYMLLVLCGKGLFANLTVVARAAIAEVIKERTLENRKKA